MAIGSGLAAQAGIVTETTINTPQAVTRFFKFDSSGFDRRPNFAQGVGLGGGILLPEAVRRLETSHDAGGDITFDVPFNGIGLFFQHMFGSFSTAPVQQGATTAYQQIHNLASTDGKTFSLQLGAPSIDGTVNPLTLSGCKVDAWELTAAPNAPVKLKLTVDAMDIAPTGAGALGLQAASYTTGNRLWGFHQATVTQASAYTTVSGLWTPTTPTSVGVVRQISLKGGFPKDKTRWQAGSTVKAEQLVNGLQPVTGQVDVDFASMALYNQFATNASTVLQVLMSGPNIASTFNYTLGFTMPAVFLEQGSTPKVGGPGVVTVSYPFTALLDSTGNGLQVQVINTDTAA